MLGTLAWSSIRQLMILALSKVLRFNNYFVVILWTFIWNIEWVYFVIEELESDTEPGGGLLVGRGKPAREACSETQGHSRRRHWWKSKRRTRFSRQCHGRALSWVTRSASCKDHTEPEGPVAARPPCVDVTDVCWAPVPGSPLTCLWQGQTYSLT